MRQKPRFDIILAGILLLSCFLNFFQIGKSGSNEFYTIAVKSMMKNFHNFFYASFDPAGFITVDKPPVALWLQTLSASIFGWSNFSVLLPEALAGVISVWLMYVIVKPKFGRTAALLSSLVLASTPIFVAVVRTNNVDSILVLDLLIGTWMLMKAADKQSLGWLLASVAMVGIGFNIKMLEAFMVLPGFYLFYLVSFKVKWTKKIFQLIIATVVLFVVSFSWAVIVDSIPKDQRPYVGSSQTDSVMELAFGYNGLSRLTGKHNGFNGHASSQAHASAQTHQAAQQSNSGKSRSGASQFHGGQGGSFGTGSPGVLRLFSKQLSGQISWLLPLVLFGIIGMIVSFRKTKSFTMEHQFTMFWAACLVPMMIFFSVAGFFHQYYMSMMGPSIAALTGISWTILSKLFKEKEGWSSYLLPFSILATFLFEAIILYENNGAVSQVWTAVVFVAGIVIFGILMMQREYNQKVHAFGLAGVIALFILPFCWGLITVIQGGNSTMPVAGPSGGGFGGMQGAKMAFTGSGNGYGHFSGMQNGSQGGFRSARGQNGAGRTAPVNGAPSGQWQRGAAQGNWNGGGMGRMMDGQADTKLIQYLLKNYHGEKFMLATENATSAYPFMEKTNYAVMAMGGFMGSDPAINPDKLAKMVKAGEVKYFLISSGMGRGGNSGVTDWIKKNCKAVPSKDWSSSNSSTSKSAGASRSFMNGRGGTQQLYVYTKA
jgi:4-amino-4-deoxy-L-arabinose transferase-like glycosyltransferase